MTNYIDDLPERDASGLYPAYAWPGGYTLIYLDAEGYAYCADCASQADAEPPVVACQTYDEGPDMPCEGCGAVLQSSYGDPDAPDDDDDDPCAVCNGLGYESIGPLNLNCAACGGTGLAIDQEV